MNFGIICEFNPFHKGHKYLFDSIKGDKDKIICAMSGSFVQRGEPAVYDKFRRAEAAIENGADLVIEIPSALSTLSAQGFARAGVSILEATGICDALAFGAECDDVNELIRLNEEITAKDKLIKEELKTGVSYPQARQNVINSPFLNEPNNILALEYLSCTKLKPIAVKRIGKGHDSNDGEYSASEIRKHIPDSEAARLNNCERAVLLKLRSMSAEDFVKIEDVSEGLENRIYSAVQSASTLDEIYNTIKTKRYTLSRIRRIILRAFLGVDKSFPSEPLYLRILAFNENGKALLTEMKESASLPIITRYSQAKEAGDEVLRAYEAECGFTDIYSLCCPEVKPCGIDKTEKIIIK